MAFLRNFERRIEGAVEGLFARAFRSGVQPVELGKRLVRAVEDSRQVGVSRVYVDNHYCIELSSRDRQRFADYEHALTSELAALVVDTARESNWAIAVDEPNCRFAVTDGERIVVIRLNEGSR